MRIALTGLPFATTMRMVNWIHDDSAHMRSATEPPATSGLADADILMVEVANLANGRHAGRQRAHHPGCPL